MLHLKRLTCYPIPLFSLLLLLGLTFTTTVLRAQAPCSYLTVTWDNWEPCRYRIVIQNNSECTPSLRLVLSSGQFAGWSASTANGWTGQLVTPNEIILTHVNGFVPLGQSIPVGFSLAPGVVTDAALLWDFTCGLGEGCAAETTLTSCPDPGNASITGVKYVECAPKPYTNQPVVPGWPIQLLNIDGVVIAEEQTGSDGRYAFYDLPYGVYWVRELAVQGWSPSFPANGQIMVDLSPSEQGTAHFGNCPACSCDSIFMNIVQLPVVNDSCSYRLALQNSSAFCFSQYDIKLTAGQFTSFNTTATGWTTVQVSPQHLRLTAPAGTVTPAGNIFPLDFKITGSSMHDITVSTTSGTGVACSRAFSYPCPPPPIPAPCCPQGSTFGPELVVNGDFQAGNTGFVSGYSPNYFTPGTNTMIGWYSVLQSNQVYSANPQWSAVEHTASMAAGRMLIVDGNNAGSNVAWREMVNVTAGTNYAFSAWLNNLVIPTRNYDDPGAQLWVNGFNIASIATIPEVPDQWIRLCGTWTATVSGLVNVEIRMANTTSIGNDLAIDDISFRACVPPPSCTCGVYSDMTYRPAQGTMNIPVMCGDTLTSNCNSAFPWTLNGMFMCQGNNCPTVTPMFWDLKDPGNITIASNPSMTANPNFSLNINSSLFAAAGVYSLTIGAICGSDTCYCTYYISSAGCGCCSSYDEFCQNLMNHITIGVDEDLCKATLTIGNLPGCDRVDWINWGDGNQTGGPFVAGSMATHTYSGNGGTFIISYLAIETNPQTGLICFEKVVHDTIVLNCDSCATPPAGMVAWWPMDDMLGDVVAVDTIGSLDGMPMSGGSIGFSAGPDPVPGKVGGALQFGGTPTYAFLEVANDPALNFGSGDFTIDAWIYTNMTTQTEPIVDKLGNTNNGYALSVQGASPYYLTLAIGNGSSVQYLSGPQVFPGQWTFVAAVVNTGTADLYVGYGGTLYQITGLPITGTANASNALPLLIGKNPLNPHWNITIDELEIFNEAVPLADLKAIFEADSIGKCKPATSSVWTPAGQGLQKMQIFPNPASGIFNVGWTFEPKGRSIIRLVDITGEIMLEKTVAEGQLNTQIQAEHLAAGMYFVQLITEGRVVSVGKVVKY